MTLTNAIESGLTGATTLTLLHEAIDKIDTKAPKTRLFEKSGIIKKIKKHTQKNQAIPPKLYIQLATELLAGIGYFGLSALGKKKNAVLRGGLLGAAAGSAVAFFNKPDGNAEDIDTKKLMRNRILTVVLYTAAGLVAGAALQKINKKKQK